MKRKKNWLVAGVLTLGMVGVAHGAAYIKYEGVKGEAASQSQQPPKDVKAKPGKPQKGLLLPAVQKAGDITPDSPPPRKGKVREAAGDVNGDGRADIVGAKPQSSGGHMRNATLSTRKSGEGQGAHSRPQASAKRNKGALNQIRTNQ